MLVVILFVGCATVAFYGQICDFITKSLVEKVVDDLAGFDFWQDGKWDQDDHLVPGALVRRTIAEDYAIEKGKEFWDVYEVVYEQLRKYYSDPEALWSDYLRLKPAILSSLRSQPEVVTKLKIIFDEEFLRHLEGKSEYSEYLSQRWDLISELDHLEKEGRDWIVVSEQKWQEIQDQSDIIEEETKGLSYKESCQWQLEHDRFWLGTGWRGDDKTIESLEYAKLSCQFGFFQSLQPGFGEHDSIWGYTSGIPQKLGFAFDFRQRRISEGGKRLADTWARIARDIMSHI